MKVRQLTKEEKEILTIALGMRENYIETGSIAYDATTVQKIQEDASREGFHGRLSRTALPDGVSVKALSVDQMKLLISSKELKDMIYRDKVFIYNL